MLSVIMLNVYYAIMLSVTIKFIRLCVMLSVVNLKVMQPSGGRLVMFKVIQ
jgi:hypothetical protein